MPCPTARPRGVVVGQARRCWFPLGGCLWSVGGRSRDCRSTAASQFSCQTQFLLPGIEGVGRVDRQRSGGWWVGFFLPWRHLGVVDRRVAATERRDSDNLGLEADRLGLSESDMRSWLLGSIMRSWLVRSNISRFALCGLGVFQPSLEGGKRDGGCCAMGMVIPTGGWCGHWASCNFYFGLDGGWVWAMLLGPRCVSLSCFYFLIISYLLFSIIPHQLVVGSSGLCPSLRTLSALSGLVRWCVVVKWTLPPSGRMKHRAAGSSGWLHSKKVVLIGDLWLCFDLIFPVCRLYYKADDIAKYAIPANLRKLEYMNFVETFAIIARSSLDAYYILGFRFYVPPCIRFH